MVMLSVHLRDALRTMRFGTVALVVQDERVIQIERNEKFRLNKGDQIDGSGIWPLLGRRIRWARGEVTSAYPG